MHLRKFSLQSSQSMPQSSIQHARQQKDHMSKASAKIHTVAQIMIVAANLEPEVWELHPVVGSAPVETGRSGARSDVGLQTEG
jgi:hypothetical protein